MNIVILGATSSIAKATAEEFAKRGATLFLASRDLDELKRIATDLNIRFNVTIYTEHFDAQEFTQHASFWQSALNKMEKIDGILLAFGQLGDQKISHQFPVCSNLINCNLTGVISILSYCKNYFAEQKKGFIIGISSVAGDRGKQSNYIYGATKAGLSLYLAGLRNELFPMGINVITVKPGFVDTPMTYGLPGVFLRANPRYVAQKILKALDKSRDVVYVPWFWRYIMLFIKLIPEKIFKRLRL